MNKTELVAAMAEQTQLSKKDAEAALKAFIDVVSEEMKKEIGRARQGKSVDLGGRRIIKKKHFFQAEDGIRDIPKGDWSSDVCSSDLTQMSRMKS